MDELRLELGRENSDQRYARERAERQAAIDTAKALAAREAQARRDLEQAKKDEQRQAVGRMVRRHG